eukprot:TRINITY_DN11060_c0_g2_i1.p1 TRINITY_DN11060_c0_g2~~TRINITY_DN11060_c0_g2_i1.p1  ORF type:complete len:330 (+),score=17.62 TRINITY_DN11060_c0_g2_i1:41-1030(+)
MHPYYCPYPFAQFQLPQKYYPLSFQAPHPPPPQPVPPRVTRLRAPNTNPRASIVEGFPRNEQSLPKALHRIIAMKEDFHNWKALYSFFKAKCTEQPPRNVDIDHKLGSLSQSSEGDLVTARFPYQVSGRKCQICGGPVIGTGEAIHLFRAAGVARMRWPDTNAPPEYEVALTQLRSTGLLAYELATPSCVIPGCSSCNTLVEQIIYFERDTDSGRWCVQFVRQEGGETVPIHTDFTHLHGQPVGEVLQRQFDCVPLMGRVLKAHADFQRTTAVLRWRAAAVLFDEDNGDDDVIAVVMRQALPQLAVHTNDNCRSWVQNLPMYHQSYPHS